MLPRLFFAIGILTLFFACGGAKKAQTEALTPTPYELMQGYFSSAAQATKDSAFYSITLRMYPIWESREGDWLYVEQAVEGMEDRPYRQRVYEVKARPDGQWESMVYTLQEEKRFIGKWAAPTFFDQFDRNVLEEREGCAVILEEVTEGTYQGFGM